MSGSGSARVVAPEPVAVEVGARRPPRGRRRSRRNRRCTGTRRRPSHPCSPGSRRAGSQGLSGAGMAGGSGLSTADEPGAGTRPRRRRRRRAGPSGRRRGAVVARRRTRPAGRAGGRARPSRARRRRGAPCARRYHVLRDRGEQRDADSYRPWWSRLRAPRPSARSRPQARPPLRRRSRRSAPATPPRPHLRAAEFAERARTCRARPTGWRSTTTSAFGAARQRAGEPVEGAGADRPPREQVACGHGSGG